MVVPLFTVTHVFAFVGMFFFSGLLTTDANFGDGKGRQPYYGLLDFSSYTNSLIIMVNLLVVNNWVNLADGLRNTTKSLWIYIYFMLFFVIGVTFCLLSLTSIFISSIMVDHDTNPVTKNAAASGNVVPYQVSKGRLQCTEEVDNDEYVVSLRHQDADKLFRIIDSISVRYAS